MDAGSILIDRKLSFAGPDRDSSGTVVVEEGVDDEA